MARFSGLGLLLEREWTASIETNIVRATNPTVIVGQLRYNISALALKLSLYSPRKITFLGLYFGLEANRQTLLTLLTILEGFRGTDKFMRDHSGQWRYSPQGNQPFPYSHFVAKHKLRVRISSQWRIPNRRVDRSIALATIEALLAIINVLKCD